MIKTLKKYCYISTPVITFVGILICYIIKSIFFPSISITIVDDMSTIIQSAGTLIGFLLTAITIFFSLPKDTDTMMRIKKYKHHIIFSRCIGYGLTTLVLCIVCWILTFPNIIVIVLFLLGLEETLMAAYYIYKLCMYNFN